MEQQLLELKKEDNKGEKSEKKPLDVLIKANIFAIRYPIKIILQMIEKSIPYNKLSLLIFFLKQGNN